MLNYNLTENSNFFNTIIKNLENILKIQDVNFFINGYFTKCFFINNQMTNDYPIVIYLKKNNSIRIETCIKQIYNNLTNLNISIIKYNTSSIKFTLNIENTEYIFIVKERDNYTSYDFYFEINHLEYDITKKQIINQYTKNVYSLNSNYINLVKSSIGEDWDYSIDLLKKISLEQPNIIFELLEFKIWFPTLITYEINYFLENLNFTTGQMDNYESDENLVFYFQLIKYIYWMEESAIHNKYIDEIITKYSEFALWIFGIKIKKDLLSIFHNYKLRDIICLFAFQYLIYNKKNIFKTSKHNYDLLESFIEQNKDSDLEENSNFENFSMLDKSKMSSLKYLKSNYELFVKFDRIVNNDFLRHKDIVYIKNFYNFELIFFTNLKNIQKHHTLKIAYSIKKFHYVKKSLLIKCVKLFNHIIKKNDYDSEYLIKDNFYSLVHSKKLNDYIHGKLTLIPEIKKKFSEKTDCIDIINYQDTILFFIDFIYRSKPDYNDAEFDLQEYDSLFEACLCDMRSYCILINDKRRKKEKKHKKEKQIKKEKKYQIKKSNPMEKLLENQENQENQENHENQENFYKYD